MAIAFRAVQQAGHAQALDCTMTLPGSVQDGDLVIAWLVKDRTTTNLQFPAGWTQLMSGKASANIAYRIWHTGDATSFTVTDTGGTSYWWLGCTLAYSGVDAVNPVIDNSANPIYFADLRDFHSSHTTYIAPSLVPDTNGAVHVALYARADSGGGGSWSTPSGYTSRQNDTYGPCVFVCDKALSSSAETGELLTTGQTYYEGKWQTGFSLLLREASASAASHSPVISQGGTEYRILQTTSIGVDISTLSPKDGDLIYVAISIDTNPGGVAINSVPSGFVAVVANLNRCYVYYRIWHTGDPTSFTFGLSTVGGVWWATVTHLFRVSGGTSGASPSVDTFGSASAVHSAATPALTPAGSNEHLMLFFGDGAGSHGTWTPPTGTGLIEWGEALGPHVIDGHVAAVNATTASYTATIASLTETVTAIATLLSPASAAPPSSTGMLQTAVSLP